MANSEATVSSLRPGRSQNERPKELCKLEPGVKEQRAFLRPIDSEPYEIQYTIKLSQHTIATAIVIKPLDAGRKIEVEIFDEGLLVVENGSCYRVMLDGAIVAASADRDRNFAELRTLVDWVAPTLREHSYRIADIAGDVIVCPDPPLWEAELARLRAHTIEDSEQLERLQTERDTHESSKTTSHRLYRLELICVRDVFAPKGSEDDAQTLWSAPLRSRENFLGREDRGVIEVVEVLRNFNGNTAETWLRHKPLPGDKAQCWSRAMCPNGRWRQVPIDDATELQAGFFIESGLQLLTISLERDPDASSALLECTRAFVQRVGPASLFRSSGVITDRALTAVMDWLTNHAADDSPAIVVLVRLVLARGTLAAVLRLAQYIRTNPAVLRQAEVMLELHKIADVSGYEESAQELFLPVPGSTNELLSVWETDVFPTVASSAGKDGPECIHMLTEMLQRGDVDAARMLLRQRLTKDTLAVLRMPRREELAARQVAVQYEQGREQVEQLGHLCRSGGTSIQALGFVVGQLSLVISQIAEERTGTSMCSMPMCIDTSESSFNSLAALLCVTFSEDGGWKEVANSEARQVACILLRLLKINLQALESQHGSMADETRSKLHALLQDGLASDSQELPHCSAVCELCAIVYSAGQSHFFRTPYERASTARNLIDELLKQYRPLVITDAMVESAAEQNPNGLVPMCITQAHPLITTKGSTDGLLLWLGDSTCVVKGTKLTHGMHYMQVELAEGSIPDTKDPQAFSTVRLGIVQADCDVNHKQHAAWMFDPLRGTASHRSGQSPDDDLEHRVQWMDEDWWTSPHSVLAGDSVGVMFDVDKKRLDAVKNGNVLGTIFEGLEGEFCFVVAARGARLHVYTADLDNVSNLTALARERIPAEDSSNRPGIERVIASLLHSIADPISISSILYSQDSHLVKQVFTDSIFKLLGYTVATWESRDWLLGHSKTTSASTVEVNKWGWGECHRSFRKSDDGKSAERLGSDPDYAGVRGERGFCTDTSADIHEWTLSISKNVDGVWVGICDESLSLGRGASLAGLPQSSGKVWWWQSSGRVWQNTGSSADTSHESSGDPNIPNFLSYDPRSSRGREVRGGRIREQQPIRLRLDCGAKTVSFFQGLDSTNPIATLQGVEGVVFPFVYFDYKSKAELIGTVSEFRASFPNLSKSVSADVQINDIDAETCGQFLSRIITMQFAMQDKNCEENLEFSVLLVKQAFEFAKAVCSTVKRADRNAFMVLERSSLRPLLSGVLSMADGLIGRRNANGDAMAASLLPQVIDLLASLQELYDLCPTALADPDAPLRISTAEFAAEHSIELTSPTAAYYVTTFGGVDGTKLSQANTQFERDKSTGTVRVPNAFSPPVIVMGNCCQVDDHWLATIADTLAGLGGKCAASLCSGLAIEEDFDISLFIGERVDLPQQLVRAKLSILSSTGIRQRWIGFNSPALEEVETTTILAMVRYIQMSSTSCEIEQDAAAVNIQGALLHCGRSALQVKNNVQDRYRLAQAAAVGKSVSWDSVAADYIARALLILQYSGSIEDTWSPPVLRQSDSTVDWEHEHSGTDHRCLCIDRIRKFIVDGPPVAVVLDKIHGRLRSASEAALGYDLFRKLLEAGVVHPSTGLLRASTRPNEPSYPTGEVLAVAGTWSFTISERQGHTIRRLYDFDLMGDQLIGCSKLNYGRAVKVDGRVMTGGEVMWTEMVDDEITAWIDGKFTRDGLFTGCATRSAADNASTTHVKLEASLVRPCHSQFGAIVHPAKRGLSLTRRRILLLQSATRAFDDVGPLASVDSEAQRASSMLIKWVLQTLCESVNQIEDLMYWCARFLLCRLSEESAVICAKETTAVCVMIRRVALANPAHLLPLDGNALSAQVAFVATLTVKLCASGNVESITTYMQTLRLQLSPDVEPAVLRQVLAALHASCHAEIVREMLRGPSWSQLLWDITGSTEMDITCRLGCLAILCHSILPTESNLQKLLTVIFETSPEAVHFGASSTKASWALAVRQNAILLVRYLCCKPAWAEYVIKGITTTETLNAKSWGLISAVGMPEVLGLGQPGSSLRFLDAKLLGDVAQAMSSGGFFKSSLNLPSEASSSQARIIRSRTLKAILEVGIAQGFQNFAALLPPIAAIATEGTTVPPGVSVEDLVAKLRSLYTFHGDVGTEGEEDAASQLVRTLSDEDANETNGSSAKPVQDNHQQLEAIVVQPTEEHYLNVDDKVERGNSTSYISTGPVNGTIAAAEDALTVLLARLIVVRALIDQTATASSTHILDTDVVTTVLRHMIHFPEGDPRIRPVCTTRNLINLRDLCATVTHWLTSIPAHYQEQLMKDILASLDGSLSAPSQDKSNSDGVLSSVSSPGSSPTVSTHNGSLKPIATNRMDGERRDVSAASDSFFTFWLLQHVLRCGWATPEFCFSACQRVLTMLFRAPPAQRPIIARAVAQFPESILERACVGKLADVLLQSTSMQLEAENAFLDSLLWSPYTQALLELVCKTNSWRPTGEALAAHRQAEGLYALAVQGHPNNTYNDIYKLGEADNGWPLYRHKDVENRFLFRHFESGRWVFSYSTQLENLESPASIATPDGLVPIGDHTWRRAGEDVKITVQILATEAECDEFVAAAEANRRSSLTRQLVGVAKVQVEGIPHRACNATYCPKGEQDGWMRFESLEGMHLFQCIKRQEWHIAEAYTQARIPRAQVYALVNSRDDGRLPLCEEWICLNDDDEWTDFQVTLTLLNANDEVMYENTAIAEAVPPVLDPEPALISEPEPEPQTDDDLTDSMIEQLGADPQTVRTLAEMGFALRGCVRAVVATGNVGLEEAMEWCLLHSEDDDFNHPMPAQSTAVPLDGSRVALSPRLSLEPASPAELSPTAEGFNTQLRTSGNLRSAERHIDSRLRTEAKSLQTLFELVPPGLEMPDRRWFDRMRDSWIDEVVESIDLDLDWDAAFAESWSLQMDTALVAYAEERSTLQQTPVSQLKLQDLFDVDLPVPLIEEGEPPSPASSGADVEMLTRNVSTAPPQFTPRDLERSPRRIEPTSLSDNTNASIRARFAILREWNAILLPKLRMVDLRLYHQDGHIAHRLCVSKGRIFSDTKEQLVERALKATAVRSNVPEVNLSVPLPGSKEALQGDNTFEQLYRQLHGKQLIAYKRSVSEAQLWTVRMHGAGVSAMFTDDQDAGGWYRVSIRQLCSDLQDQSVELLCETPNSVTGRGDGDEAMLRFIPNPRSTSKKHLDRYMFLGVLMGASCRTNAFIEIDFAPLVFKHLLGERITSQEVRAVDARAAELLDAAAADMTAEEWSALQAVQPVCWNVQLLSRFVALRGDGSAQVEYEERAEFVRSAEERWFAQFLPQLRALSRGFFSTFPQLATRLLTWRELEKRVCGSPDVNVTDLRRIAKYEGSYERADAETVAYLEMFWDVLENFTGAERKSFLGFCWGRGRLPSRPSHPFTIDSSGGNDDDMLPRSHTCMFQLHLPRYSSKFILRQRLQTAIQNSGKSTHSEKPADSYMQQPIEPADDAADSTVLLTISVDPGHSETLEDFLQRSRVGSHHAHALCSILGIRDMGELLSLTSKREGTKKFEKCLLQLFQLERYAPAIVFAGRLRQSSSPRAKFTAISSVPSSARPSVDGAMALQPLEPPSKISRFTSANFRPYFDRFAQEARATSPSETTKSCRLIKTLEHLFRFMKDDHYTNAATRKEDAISARNEFGRKGGFELITPLLGPDSSKVLYYNAVKQVAQCTISCKANKDFAREAGLLPLLKRFLTVESVEFTKRESDQSAKERRDSVRPIKLLVETTSAIANAAANCPENRRCCGTLGFVPLLVELLRVDNDLALVRKAIIGLSHLCGSPESAKGSRAADTVNCAQVEAVPDAVELIGALSRFANKGETGKVIATKSKAVLGILLDGAPETDLQAHIKLKTRAGLRMDHESVERARAALRELAARPGNEFGWAGSNGCWVDSPNPDSATGEWKRQQLEARAAFEAHLATQAELAEAKEDLRLHLAHIQEAEAELRELHLRRAALRKASAAEKTWQLVRTLVLRSVAHTNLRTCRRNRMFHAVRAIVCDIALARKRLADLQEVARASFADVPLVVHLLESVLTLSDAGPGLVSPCVSVFGHRDGVEMMIGIASTLSSDPSVSRLCCDTLTVWAREHSATVAACGGLQVATEMLTTHREERDVQVAALRCLHNLGECLLASRGRCATVRVTGAEQIPFEFSEDLIVQQLVDKSVRELIVGASSGDSGSVMFEVMGCEDDDVRPSYRTGSGDWVAYSGNATCTFEDGVWRWGPWSGDGDSRYTQRLQVSRGSTGEMEVEFKETEAVERGPVRNNVVGSIKPATGCLGAKCGVVHEPARIAGTIRKIQLIKYTRSSPLLDACIFEQDGDDRTPRHMKVVARARIAEQGNDDVYQLARPMNIEAGQYLGVLCISGDHCGIAYARGGQTLYSYQSSGFSDEEGGSYDTFIDGRRFGVSITGNTLCVAARIERVLAGDDVPESVLTAESVVGLKVQTVNRTSVRSMADLQQVLSVSPKPWSIYLSEFRPGYKIDAPVYTNRKAIVNCMRGDLACVEVQEAACHCLAVLSAQVGEKDDSMVSASEAALKAICQHKSEVGVARFGLRALVSLVVEDEQYEDTKAVLSGLLQLEALQGVISAVKAHPLSEDVQKCGCVLFGKLVSITVSTTATNSRPLAVIVDAGCVQLVLAILTNHAWSSGLWMDVFEFLMLLVTDDLCGAQAFVSACGPACICTAMLKAVEVEELQVLGLKLLSRTIDTACWTDELVTETLLNFYQTQHPGTEYASIWKVWDIINGFKRKGRDSGRHWVALMWEEYAKSGLDPREYRLSVKERVKVTEEQWMQFGAEVSSKVKSIVHWIDKRKDAPTFSRANQPVNEQATQDTCAEQLSARTKRDYQPHDETDVLLLSRDQLSTMLVNFAGSDEIDELRWIDICEDVQAEQSTGLTVQQFFKFLGSCAVSSLDAMVEAMDKRKQAEPAVAEIFGYYDIDRDGMLNSTEYKHFLIGIGYYGNHPDCTNERYADYGWPYECRTLKCDPLAGITWAAFEGGLYSLYRRQQLQQDLVATREHQLTLSRNASDLPLSQESEMAPEPQLNQEQTPTAEPEPSWTAEPPPIPTSPGPVACDDSSGDDDDLGIVKIKFGAEDVGPLGIEFKEVSVRSVNPSGMGQFRAARPVVPGMVLRAINGVPVDRLAFNAILELTGHDGGDIRGLTLTLQHEEQAAMQRPPRAQDGSPLEPQELAPVLAEPPPIPTSPGPVACDDSSGDDDDLGIVKIKFGAEDVGPLGIEFKEVSVRSVNPSGMGQFRAARPVVPGMVLRAINGVPVDRLAFNAILELTGHDEGDIRGLTLTLQHEERQAMPVLERGGDFDEPRLQTEPPQSQTATIQHFKMRPGEILHAQSVETIAAAALVHSGSEVIQTLGCSLLDWLDLPAHDEDHILLQLMHATLTEARVRWPNGEVGAQSATTEDAS